MGSTIPKVKKSKKVKVASVEEVVEEIVEVGKNEEMEDVVETVAEVAKEEEEVKKVDKVVVTEMIAPPEGYPTAAQAFESPVVVVAGAEGVEATVDCVICPTKRLKQGRMLEVHLGGKVSFCCFFFSFVVLALTVLALSGPQEATHAIQGAY